MEITPDPAVNGNNPGPSSKWKILGPAVNGSKFGPSSVVAYTCHCPCLYMSLHVNTVHVDTCTDTRHTQHARARTHARTCTYAAREHACLAHVCTHIFPQFLVASFASWCSSSWRNLRSHARNHAYTRARAHARTHTCGAPCQPPMHVTPHMHVTHACHAIRCHAMRCTVHHTTRVTHARTTCAHARTHACIRASHPTAPRHACTHARMHTRTHARKFAVQVDDPVDAVAVHGGGGLCGMLTRRSI